MTIADYIADHYGRCELEEDCLCLRTDFRGRECPNWRPVSARTWAELREEVSQQRVTRDTAGAP